MPFMLEFLQSERDIGMNGGLAYIVIIVYYFVPTHFAYKMCTYEGKEHPQYTKCVTFPIKIISFIKQSRSFHFVDGSSCCEITRMGAGLTSAADRVSERLSPRLIISGGVRRRLTRPSDTLPTRSVIEQAFKIVQIHLRGQQTAHAFHARPPGAHLYAIPDVDARDLITARRREKKKRKEAAASGAASEIYGGAAPPGAEVSPNRRGSRLPGNAMRARVGLHGEY